MYLLDTNVLAELRKQARGDANVLSWFKRADADTMFISPIVVAEIEIGVRSKERRDPVQGRLLRAWADKINAEFENRCVPIGQEIARIFAALHVPDPRPERDAWIAATALHGGLTVVTRNASDFDAMKVPILDPWKA